MAYSPVPPDEVVPRPAVAFRGTRPAPERHQDFDHLALDELRAYREKLAQEETRASYGRRVLQIILADLREGRGAEATRSALHRALDLEAGRSALLERVPAGGLPQISARVRRLDATASGVEPASALAALAATDRQLGEYQEAVRVRVAAATAELIARYRERPTLAVRALPLTPVVQPRETRY